MIDEGHLYRTLESIRHGNTLEFVKEIARDFSFMVQPDCTSLSYEVTHGLICAIRRQYHRMHKLLDLPVAIGNEPRKKILSYLVTDFSLANSELEAWSLLYFRYVRIDLDLSREDLTKIIGQSLRNLSRRQKLGLVRLLYYLHSRQSLFRNNERHYFLRSSTQEVLIRSKRAT